MNIQRMGSPLNRPPQNRTHQYRGETDQMPQVTLARQQGQAMSPNTGVPAIQQAWRSMADKQTPTAPIGPVQQNPQGSGAAAMRSFISGLKGNNQQQRMHANSPAPERPQAFSYENQSAPNQGVAAIQSTLRRNPPISGGFSGRGTAYRRI